MSTGTYGTGISSPRSSDVQFHARPRTLTTRNVNAARPGEGRRKRVSKGEDGLNTLSSSAVFNPQFHPRSLSKQRNPAFVEEPKSPLRLSNSSSSNILSSQTIRSHPPRTSNSNPTTSYHQTPPHKPVPYHGEAEEVDLFTQAPNPPLPKFTSSPHLSGEGISGTAAALAYLRFRGLANRGRKKTFYTVLAWILRHAARNLGFEIVADGFVRISDLLRFELFQNHTLETFSTACVSDMFDRFEVMSLPDLVNGQLQEIWWARARATQTIPGVLSSNKRIINMGKLQTVVYRAPFTHWPKIQQYGILEDPDRLIRLYQSEAPYFRNIVPRHSKHICITIDAPKAAELGVMFFHTLDVDLLAVAKDGAIPVEAIRSVVELEVTKQDLM